MRVGGFESSYVLAMDWNEGFDCEGVCKNEGWDSVCVGDVGVAGVEE